MRLRLLVPLLLLAGCDDNRLRPEGPAAPDPVAVRIEYRVQGTIRNLDITYSNASQGTAFVTADPPWFLTFDTHARQDVRLPGSRGAAV